MKEFKNILIDLIKDYEKQIDELREVLKDIHPLAYEKLNEIPLRMLVAKSKIEILDHLLDIIKLEDA